MYRLFRGVRTASVRRQLTTECDVLVLGSGMNGSALSCALGRSPLLRDHRIVMLDGAPRGPSLPKTDSPYSNRVVALRPGSVDFLDALGAWATIESIRAHPFTDMQVWDALGGGEIHFSAAEVGNTELGYLVENNLIQAALLDRISTLKNVETAYGAKVTGIELPTDKESPELVTVKTDGATYRTRLLIGADGVNSLVRKSAKFDFIGWEYGQHGVVATLRIDDTAGVNGTAWQRFLPTGPLALLPISATHCSMVWSTSPAIAAQLCSVPTDAFVDCVNTALAATPNDTFPFTIKMGAAKSFSPSKPPSRQPPRVVSVEENSRAGFPLGLGHSVQYVAPRVALIGDAAHRVHPLAGQGVNLGFADAQELTRNVEESVRCGQDIGSIHSLLTYETTRQRANAPMMIATDVLKRLFTNDSTPLSIVRSMGLSFTNSLTPVKALLMQQAMS